MTHPAGSLKIVLCGEPEVGKTTLRRKYMGKSFRTTYKPTIGVDFSMKECSYGKIVAQLQIWDLGSQEAFQSVRKMYYRSACGALLLFDVTNPKSCQNLKMWVDEIWANNGYGIIPVIVIGNKIDLRESMNTENMVDPQFGEKFAQELSALTKKNGFSSIYLETSAKLGENVERAFKILFGKIVTRFGLDKAEDPTNSSHRRENLLMTQTHPEGEEGV